MWFRRKPVVPAISLITGKRFFAEFDTSGWRGHEPWKIYLLENAVRSGIDSYVFSVHTADNARTLVELFDKFTEPVRSQVPTPGTDERLRQVGAEDPVSAGPSVRSPQGNPSWDGV